jgi:hypothetical protein
VLPLELLGLVDCLLLPELAFRLLLPADRLDDIDRLPL